ncbi:hypothetical protein KAW65_08045 [candidate division WOR-3 bacterium]|nr:hypothetical protein [candidate division WOR-3 bacterium]
MIVITCFLFNLGYLVDLPNTYILPQGGYDITIRLEPDGGMIARIGMSPFEGFMFGISEGGKYIIGAGTPEWHSSPGIQAKFGIKIMPVSFAIGFDSEEYSSRETSLGIYGVIGGDLEGKIIPYLGVNYYKKVGEGFNPRFWGGCEAGISKSISLLAEGLFHDKFIFNLGLRWIFRDRIMLEFDFKDAFNNNIRTIKFSYTDYI